jgi:hypothetical protein
MASSREERLAENEDAFRHLNDELGVMGVYVCECADAACRDHVQMSRERYSTIRADSRRFFVRPGHETPDVETVVERETEFFVVEKPERVSHIVDAPRGP